MNNQNNQPQEELSSLKGIVELEGEQLDNVIGATGDGVKKSSSLGNILSCCGLSRTNSFSQMERLPSMSSDHSGGENPPSNQSEPSSPKLSREEMKNIVYTQSPWRTPTVQPPTERKFGWVPVPKK